MSLLVIMRGPGSAKAKACDGHGSSPGNWVCFTWLGSVLGGTWWEEFYLGKQGQATCQGLSLSHR